MSEGEGAAGRWFRRALAQRRSILASVLAILLLAPVSIAAWQAEGFDRTKVNLHDGGVWVTFQQESLVGRLNTETHQIEVSFAALSHSDALAQHARLLLVNDPESGQVGRIDTGSGLNEGAVSFGDGAVLALGGGATGPVVDEEPEVVAAVTATDGRVWVAPAPTIHNLNPEVDEPTLQAGEGSVSVVDVAGVAHVYDPGAAEITSATTTGVVGRVDVGIEAERVAITAVGGKPVVADRDGLRVVLPTGEVVDLSADAEAIALQQPSPDDDSVLVATDRSLLEIDLVDGTVEVVHEGVRGAPVAPVRVDGCSYAAWSGDAAASIRRCDGAAVEVTAPEIMQRISPRDELVFRVNWDRVVLNAVSTGLNLLFTPDEPVVVDDWSQAQTEDPPIEDRPKEETTDRPECQETPMRPQIGTPAITVGARPNRTVVVPVLDLGQVSSDPCDVLNIELPDASPRGLRADIVDDGAALQLTTEQSATGTIRVPYALRGRTGKADAAVVVEVHGTDVNTAPVAMPDETSLVLGPNRSSVKHDVLLNDQDPEGDVLTLVDAMPDSRARDIQVSFQASGIIEVMAGSSATGDQKVLYIVEDERGIRSDEPGELIVRVRPAGVNNVPTARADRVTAVVGRPITVDLLANDSDLDGDPLQVVQLNNPTAIDASDLDADSGEVSLVARSTAGSPFFFSYLVKDGSTDPPVEGMVRVDVLPEGDRRPPVAVVDEVVVRPGGMAVVDLTRNDIGDGVLAVTSLTPDQESSEVEVELIDLHIARVTATASFEEGETYTYELEDGIEGHRTTGQLRIRPHSSAAHNLPPVTQSDEVALRAGTATSVAVLANDVDPEGEQLALVPTLRTDQLPEDPEVQAFVVRDQVHIVASAGASGTHRVGYTATDPGDSSVKDDSILVRIIGQDEPNRPPRDPHLVGRVRAGRSVPLPLPLVGLDPDGDVVSVTGLELPPRLGTVTFEGGEVRYTADADLFGADRFTYRLDDGNGGVTIAEADVLVLARSTENRDPVAVLDEVDVGLGGTRTIDVLGNDTDPDGDTLQIQTEGVDKLTQPRYGSVELVEGRVVYRQDQGAPNVSVDPVLDGFTYGITDGNGNFARGQVSVRVRAEVPEVPPAARDDLQDPIGRGDEVVVDVLLNDFDPDDPGKDLTVTFPDLDRVVAETGATIEADGSTVTITSSSDEARSIVLPYRVTDADDLAADALVVVPVLADLPPVARPDTAVVKGGEQVSIPVLANDADPEGGSLRVIEVAGDRGATKVSPKEDGTVDFTADPDAQGSGGFHYQVEDEAGNRTWGRVSVEITGQNFAPTLADGTVAVSAGGESRLDLTMLAADQNPSDVDALTFAAEGSREPGIEVAAAGSRSETLVVTAAVDANGRTVEVPVTVTDSAGESDSAVVVVTVSPFEGQPPTALPDASTTIQDKKVTFDVVENDDPGSAGDLTIPETGEPTSPHGEVTVAGDRRTLSFTPASGFHGEVRIAYTVQDATGEESRRSTSQWSITVIGRPSPPLSPTGEPDDRKVYLSWVPPAANGAPITGYEIRATGPGPAEVRRIDHPGTTYTFDGLTNDRQYTFEVRALNQATAEGMAEDNWSPPSPAYTPDVVPEPPGMPTLTFGDRQITVDWAAAVTRGSEVSAYELEITGPDRNQVFPLGAVTSEVVRDLTNGSTYRFRVRAKNRRDWGGWSPYSDPDSPGAQPAGKPLAPSAVTATAGDQLTVGRSVRVDWTWTRGAAGRPPTGQGNGAEAESFVVAYEPIRGTGGSAGQVSVAKDVRAHTFADLVNGVDYRFSVHVVTKAGAGDPRSDEARPSKKPTPVGGTPTAVNGDRSAAVSFGASPADADGPGDGGEPESFEYQITTTPARTGGTLRTTSTSVTVDGLSNAQSNAGSYTISIAACNVNGCSAAREITGVRPFAAPAAPAVTPARDGGSASWSWPAVSANGRPIVGYEVRVGSGSWTMQTGRTVSRSIGVGDSIEVCVRTVAEGDTPSSARLTSRADCKTVTRPAPTARVTNSDEHQTVTGCSTWATCYRVRLLLTDVPNGSYEFECHGGRTFTFTVSGNQFDGTSFGSAGNVCVTGVRQSFSHVVTGPGDITATLSGESSATSTYDVSAPLR